MPNRRSRPGGGCIPRGRFEKRTFCDIRKFVTGTQADPALEVKTSVDQVVSTRDLAEFSE